MSDWNTMNTLEEICISIHRIENLLQIYEEHIEEELHYLHECESGGVVGHFIARYDLLRSLLESIQSQTHIAADSIHRIIETIRAAISAAKESAA